MIASEYFSHTSEGIPLRYKKISLRGGIKQNLTGLFYSKVINI